MRFPLAATVLLGLALAPAPARAEDNMLRGPHPFLKENELSAHVLLASGLGDSPSGTKMAFEYGWKMAAPLWLDLQLDFQAGNCHVAPGGAACGPDTGNAFETLAGVKWKWATAIPVVPFAKASGGLVFVFPNGATSAMGLMARAAGGANYFFFDWLGLGAEVGFSIGRVAYDSSFPGSHTYGVVDFGAGLEFQF